MPVTFGYREIWVDGPNIMLNGMPVRFFGASHNYYGSYYWTPVDLADKHHINMTMDRTQSTWWRAYRFADQPAQLADRWGHFYSINPKREPAILSRYLYNAGLKSEHFNLRHTFIRDAGHPLFQGLSDADLSHWRGESDILKPYQHFDKTGFDWTEPRTNWAKHGVINQWGQRRRFEPQWSNRNMVATFCYHKPQAGRFRVLLDGGFDSLFTPLVEIGSQAGRVLLCQLDVTNRYGVDPVVTLLVDRMVGHYSRKTGPVNGAVAVLGGADTRALVQRLGFAPAAGKPPVIVLQPGAVSPEQAAEAVEAVKAGATCLVLGATEASDLDSLSRAGLITFYWATGTTAAVSLDGAPRLLAGLSASDFFYRRAMPGVLAKAGGHGWRGAAGVVHVAKVGEGSVAYLAVRPEVLEGESREKRPAWQTTLVRWTTSKYCRIVSTILSNAGAVSTTGVDLLRSDGSSSLCVHDAIDFDPMESRTW